MFSIHFNHKSRREIPSFISALPSTHLNRHYSEYELLDDMARYTTPPPIEDEKVPRRRNKNSIQASVDVTLPAEIWERIFLYLDTRDIHSMTAVSKLHSALITTPFFCSRYFLQHHKRCDAICAASGHPRLFTYELLQVRLYSIYF